VQSVIFGLEKALAIPQWRTCILKLGKMNSFAILPNTLARAFSASTVCVVGAGVTE
jgi:hypothetical protein